MNTRETKKNGKRLTGTLAVVLTLAVMVCSAFPNIVSHAEGKDRSQNTPVRITVRIIKCRFINMENRRISY